MTEKDVQPKLKVNAVFALQTFLETCQYPIVTLTEAYLLPHMLEAALFGSDKRTYAKTSGYFREKGFQNGIANLDQLSHNYVTMMTELIFLMALVKPSRLFFGEPMEQFSEYNNAAQQLAGKGLAKKEEDKK